MKTLNKSNIWTISIIILVLLLAIGIINFPKNSPELTKETAICIGNNSVLYIQENCGHCHTQLEKFGEFSKYLTTLDCSKGNNFEICLEKNILGTPTWIINEKQYSGVQSIEKLKILTKCNINK